MPVRLGEQTLSVNLDGMREVSVVPVGEVERVACSLVVRRGDKEIYRESLAIGDAGLLKNPDFEDGIQGWSRFTSHGAEPRFDLDTNEVPDKGGNPSGSPSPRLSDLGHSPDVMAPSRGIATASADRSQLVGSMLHGAEPYGTFMIPHLHG